MNIQSSERSEALLATKTVFKTLQHNRPVGHPVAKGSVSVDLQVSMVDLDTLLPAPGAQLVQIGTELDSDLAMFGKRASEVMVDLLSRCGSWPSVGISQVTYQDPYVSSPLVARLVIDTMSQIFSASAATDASLIIETRLPRANEQRGSAWQIGHDWREPLDQKDVIELYGEQKGLKVSLLHKEVPHGRYLTIDFRDGSSATIVLDQGFGAWAPPRQIPVRFDFEADKATQVKRLAIANAVLQRKGTGRTYIVAAPKKASNP